MTSKITKGLFGPHIKVTYKHTCNDECQPNGGTHVMYKRERSFQSQLEGVLDDMVEYYENGDDIAEEAAMWAKDWATQRALAYWDAVREANGG